MSGEATPLDQAKAGLVKLEASVGRLVATLTAERDAAQDKARELHEAIPKLRVRMFDHVTALIEHAPDCDEGRTSYRCTRCELLGRIDVSFGFATPPDGISARAEVERLRGAINDLPAWIWNMLPAKNRKALEEAATNPSPATPSDAEGEP